MLSIMIATMIFVGVGATGVCLATDEENVAADVAAGDDEAVIAEPDQDTMADDEEPILDPEDAPEAPEE